MAAPIVIESILEDRKVTILEVSYGTVSFGREPENTIVFDNPAVSRIHGVLVDAGSQWVYYDNESTNFSWLNSNKLTPYDLKIIRPGDVLKISDYNLGIALSSKSGVATPSTELSSLLVFFQGKFKFEYSFSDPSKVFRVGGLEAELHVDGEPPQTVQFMVEAAKGDSGQGLKLTPASSTTPISLNGNQVTEGSLQLSDSDMLTIGAYRIVASLPLPKPAVSESSAKHSGPTPIKIKTGGEKLPDDKASGGSPSPIFSLQNVNQADSASDINKSSPGSSSESLPMDTFHQITSSGDAPQNTSAVSEGQGAAINPPQSDPSSQLSPIYSQENLPSHLKERLDTDTDDWKSEGSKRKRRLSQSFVFDRSSIDNQKPSKVGEETAANRSISHDDLSGMGVAPRRPTNFGNTTTTTGQMTPLKPKAARGFGEKLIFALIPFIFIVGLGSFYILFLK